MHPLAPIDELALLRAEIRELQQREQALRNLILDSPAQTLAGRWYRGELREQRSRRFDPGLLPPAIGQDPRYWRERIVTVLTCRDLHARPSDPPGWRALKGTRAPFRARPAFNT